MKHIKKIYKLLLIGNENSFKLAYSLSQSNKSFTIDGIVDYYIEMNNSKKVEYKDHEIYKFYNKLYRKYNNLIKWGELEETEHRDFSKKIYKILRPNVINNRIKYNKLLSILNNETYPILFSNTIEKVEIKSYNKKRNTVHCVINDRRSYKYYKLDELFDNVLKYLIII